MAQRHIIDYYLQVQNDYLLMLDTYKEVQEAVKSGYLEQSRIDEVYKDISLIKDNYERLAYIIFLLNQPNKEIKHKRYIRQNKQYLDALESSSPTSIYKENTQCLAKIKDFIKDYKNIKQEKEI